MSAFQAKQVEALQRGISGTVIQPGDADYDAARTIWNAMIDKRPALIVRCLATSDVVQAVNFARTHKLSLAVRSGGHNIAGSALCDDGLVVDLSQMKAAKVDKGARRVTIEAGATLGDLDAATQVAWPRHPGRHQLHDRRRRADGRRRLRLAEPQVRDDHRQSRERRGRDCGR